MIHSIFFLQKKFLLAIITVIFLSGILSCNNAEVRTESGTDSGIVTGVDEAPTSSLDTMMIAPPAEDSIVFRNDSGNHKPEEEGNKENPIKNPAEVPEIKIAKGTAMVYCPGKMIDGLPSIVNATLTKEELTTALNEFKKKMGAENPEASAKEIENDIKSETIDLYENMAVKLEFDPGVFKISPGETILTKSFGDKKQLDWEWDITPLHTTERSYIHFKFYYADVANNTLQEILDKRISVDVKVDNRAFLDKWKTFILGDPKTTTTAILIPLATFLGGFLTGKNKKAP